MNTRMEADAAVQADSLPSSVTLLTILLSFSFLPARRNEDDGCQIVEGAATGRALSTRSCTGLPTSARCPRGRPTSYATTRRAGRP